MSTPTIDLHSAKRQRVPVGQGPIGHTVAGEQPENREQERTQPSYLHRARVLRGLVWLDDIVPLPQTLKGYLLFALTLTVVCGLAVFQVWTSLRITQTRGELEALRVQYSLIEQRNAELLWQIGQRTTLEQVQSRAVQLDFRPALRRNYIPIPYSVEGEESQTGIAPAAAPPVSAADFPNTVQRPPPPAPQTVRPLQAEAHETGSDAPSPWSVAKRSPVAGFEQLASGWQRQINERWQSGWQSARQWGEPLLERASDFFLGQLKQP